MIGVMHVVHADHEWGRLRQSEQFRAYHVCYERTGEICPLAPGAGQLGVALGGRRVVEQSLEEAKLLILVHRGASCADITRASVDGMFAHYLQERCLATAGSPCH